MGSTNFMFKTASKKQVYDEVSASKKHMLNLPLIPAVNLLLALLFVFPFLVFVFLWNFANPSDLHFFFVDH